eukprot:3982910-Pyramimonas_sp.AAC.1
MLSSTPGRVNRFIFCDVISRALYIYYWGKKNTHIASQTTFQALVSRSIGIVMGSAVDREFLDRFPAGAMYNDGVRTCVQILIRLGAASDNEASALAHDAV